VYLSAQAVHNSKPIISLLTRVGVQPGDSGDAVKRATSMTVPAKVA
jgi:hypothetical protein